MTDPEKPTHEDATEAAIREALESVERIERERKAAGSDDLDPDEVEILRASDSPPSGDPSAEGDPPGEDEVHLEEEEPAPKQGGGNAMLAAMIQAKNEAVAALEQTQKEAKSLHERLLRVSADFDNYKKRQSRERAEAVKFANEGLLKELLPVLDNMERAIQAARANTEAGAGAVVEGVEMVHRQFMDALGRFGVVGFSALGQRFDPARHEAVAQREDTSVPSQTVIEEYQRGYLLHDRLVRPAMVVVSSGGPVVPAGADGAARGEDAASEGQPDGVAGDHDEGAGA